MTVSGCSELTVNLFSMRPLQNFGKETDKLFNALTHAYDSFWGLERGFAGEYWPTIDRIIVADQIT